MTYNKAKIFFLFFVCSITTGCAITEAVAITGLSYLVTGKSVSDNALSMVTNMDCKTHNIIQGKDICNEYDKTKDLSVDTLIAAVPPVAQDSFLLPIQATAEQRKSEYIQINDEVEPAYTAALFSETDSGSVDHLLVQSADTASINTQLAPEKLAKVNTKSTSAMRPDKLTPQGFEKNNHRDFMSDNKQIYAVVGSFNELEYAQFRQSLYSNYDAQISRASNDENSTYRVVIGPLNDESELTNIPSKKDTETFMPWIIELCDNNSYPTPCNTPMLASKTITEQKTEG